VQKIVVDKEIVPKIKTVSRVHIPAKSKQKKTIVRIHRKESIPDLTISETAINAHKQRGNTFVDVEIFPEVDKILENRIKTDQGGEKRLDSPVNRFHLVAVLPDTFPYFRLNHVTLGISYYKDTVLQTYRQVQHIGHDAGVLYLGVGHHDEEQGIPRAMEIGDHKIIYGGVGFSLRGTLDNISRKKGYKISRRGGKHIPTILEILAVIAAAKLPENHKESAKRGKPAENMEIFENKKGRKNEEKAKFAENLKTLRRNARLLLNDVQKIRKALGRKHVVHEIMKEISGAESLIMNTHILKNGETTEIHPEIDKNVQQQINEWYNAKLVELKPEELIKDKNGMKNIEGHAELRHIGWVADRAQAVEYTVKKILAETNTTNDTGELADSVRRVAYFLAGVPLKHINEIRANTDMKTLLDTLHKERVFLLPPYKLGSKKALKLETTFIIESKEGEKTKYVERTLAKRNAGKLKEIDDETSDNAKILKEYPGEPSVAIDKNGYIYLSAGRVAIPLNVALARSPVSESQREIHGVLTFDGILEDYAGLLKHQENIHGIQYQNEVGKHPLHGTRDLLLMAGRALAEDRFESLLREYITTSESHKRWVRNRNASNKNIQIPKKLEKSANIALREFIRNYAEHTWDALHNASDDNTNVESAAQLLVNMYLTVGGKNLEAIDKLADRAVSKACPTCNGRQKSILKQIVAEIGRRLHAEMFAAHILMNAGVNLKLPNPSEELRIPQEIPGSIEIPQDLQNILASSNDPATRELREVINHHFANRELPIPNAIERVPRYMPKDLFKHFAARPIMMFTDPQTYLMTKIKPMQVARLENTAYTLLPITIKQKLSKIIVHKDGSHPDAA